MRLTLAHSLEPAHTVHKAMVRMDERLRELSGGTMQIDIYPSGQLGEEREAIELLQIGSLAMTKGEVRSTRDSRLELRLTRSLLVGARGA